MRMSVKLFPACIDGGPQTRFTLSEMVHDLIGCAIALNFTSFCVCTRRDVVGGRRSTTGSSTRGRGSGGALSVGCGQLAAGNSDTESCARSLASISRVAKKKSESISGTCCLYMCRRCTCRPKLEEDNGFGPGGPRCAPRPYQGPSQFAVDMINIKLHTHYPQRKSCPGLPRMLLCRGVC